MSYILEALKKSEHERTRGVAPTLHAVHAEPSAEPRRAVRYYPPVLAVLVVAALVGWLRPWQPEKGGAGVPVVSAVVAAKAAQPPHIPSQAAPAERPAAPVIREPSPPALRDAIGPKEKPMEEAPRPVKAPPLKPARPPAVVATAPSAVAPAPKPPAESAARPAAGQDVIEFSELPVAVQRVLPKLAISGYVNYPGDPSGRMVAIGDRLVREGEEISSGLKLEQIAATGAIFSYKGYRFRAPVP